MRRIFFVISFLLLLLLAGLVLGQATTMGFEEVARLGQARPRGLQYDANFDRIVWVDALGRLQLVDAKTFEVQHTLYETGFYNAYAFSHNGAYLALAIDLRVEIWDSNTGELLLTFPPDGALRVEAPLYWSLDDTLISINTQVRAPQELRRSENDTTNLPWVWDIAAELGERRTILPNARAIPFFDYRNGFVYGANNVAVTGLATRLQVIDTSQPNGSNLIAEIPANRFEPDPMFAWFSLREDYIYVRPDERSSSLVQIDTATKQLVTIEIGRDYNLRNLDQLDGLQLSRMTRIIGNPLDQQDNSLMRYFFGDDYRSQFNYNETTVTLVDFLTPATQDSGTKTVALLYIFDEPRATGHFEFVDFYSASGFDISPDNNSLVVRRTNSPERIEIYNLDTGIMTQSFLPAMPEVAREGLLAFNGTSSVVISDYQRFDVATGEVLFENLHYNNGFDIFYWNDDSETLLTANGNRLWEWDIMTGEVIRRETLHLGEVVVGESSDGERYLVAMSNSRSGGVSRTYELVEVGMEERTRVSFQDLPDVQIEQVIYSPNGRNFMVVYSTNSYNQHAPGNQIMIYNLDEGALWHLAGDDLPYMTSRSYNWLDDQTIYIYSEEGTAAPERIYGIEYHPAGIPQCLAEAFPEKISEWGLVWERLNARMPSDDLNRLAQGTCALLPNEETVVTNFIFPSATPTRLPVTATPATIAGVPLCLTNRFSTEARDYAEIWQELTDGMNDEQIAEMEMLLCENLAGQSSPQFEPQLVTNNVQVMTMDILTGVRMVGSYVPERERILPPNIELVTDAFSRQYGSYPDGRLSPNTTLFAVRSQTGQIIIYRLVNPYRALADSATATADFFVAQSSPAANLLSLRPTATRGFVYLGEPRPTFTPTITPTSPPMPATEEYWPQFGESTEVCPYNNLFTLENPPPDYAASGRIIARRLDDIGISGIDGHYLPWILEPETGDFTLQDSLPVCHANGSCDLSYDGQWMTYSNEIGDFMLARPDGSHAEMLFTVQEVEAQRFSGFRWLEYHTLAISAAELDAERAPYSRTYFDPETGAFSQAFNGNQPSYNELSTRLVSEQTGLVNRYAIAQTSFNTGRGEGYRYFLYDRAEGDFTYFARSTDETMQFNWDEFGDMMLFKYPNDANWYAFLPATEEFVFIGDQLFNGAPSRDGRWLIDSYSFPSEQREARIEAGQPIPNLQLWDSTNATRRLYCVPEFERMGNDGTWSPDGRYWLFQDRIPADEQYENPPFRSFVLDLQTGSVTEISQLAGEIVLWMEETYP